jgi:hypothetical protein
MNFNSKKCCNTGFLWYLGHMENEILYVAVIIWLCTIGVLVKIHIEG